MSRQPSKSGPPNAEPCELASQWLGLVRRLSVSGRRLRDQLARHSRAVDLNDTQTLILWTCRQSPGQGVAQKDLAEMLGISNAQVSGLVERLRQRGLLDARRLPGDRRRQLWKLTPAGRTALQDVLAGWSTQLGPMDADGDLVATLASLLTRVDDCLDFADDRSGVLARPRTDHGPLVIDPERDVDAA